MAQETKAPHSIVVELKRWKWGIAAGLVLAAIVVALTIDWSPPVREPFAFDEHAVYSAVASRLCAGERDDARIAIIDLVGWIFSAAKSPHLTEAETRGLKDLLHAEKIPDEVIDAFIANNAHPASLPPSLRTPCQVRIFGKDALAEYQKVNAGGGPLAGVSFNTWFAKRYPGARGYAMFSRIGFDQAGVHALVYRVWSCGEGCEDKAFFLLQLDRAWGWQVEKAFGGNLLSPTGQ